MHHPAPREQTAGHTASPEPVCAVLGRDDRWGPTCGRLVQLQASYLQQAVGQQKRCCRWDAWLLQVAALQCDMKMLSVNAERELQASMTGLVDPHKPGKADKRWFTCCVSALVARVRQSDAGLGSSRLL